MSLPSLLEASRRRPADFLVREWGSESIHSIVYASDDQQANYSTMSRGAHEIDHLRIQDRVRTEGDNILTHTNMRPFSYLSYPFGSVVAPTFIGVMIDSTFFELSSSTPLNMLISSSRNGSSPVRWNCRKDLSSAFLYVLTSFLPSILSRSLAIGHAIGAILCIHD